MILVIGATGTTGSQVVTALTAAGERVRALARTPEKAQAIAGPGVEFVRGDLADPRSLASALRGVDRVFLVSAPDPAVGRLHANAYAAARGAGVRHLVRLSALGSDPRSPVSLLRWHGDADAALSRAGVPFTVLRPHYFMQNTLWFADSIRQQGAFYAPMRDGRISAIDARDIGAVAAAILRDPGRHAGRHYDLTGPAALGFQEVADAIGTAIGRPIRYVDVPPAAARDALLGMGLPDWLAGGLLELYGEFAAGKASAVSPVVAEILGRSGLAFEQFARDHVAAFSGA